MEEFENDPARHEDPKFSDNQENYRNLYYHHDFAKGLRFGARLVPVARLYSWHEDLVADGKGLDELIGKTIDDARWFKVDDAFARPAAFFRRTGAGGVFVMNEKDRSWNTVMTTGMIMPA